MRFRYSKKIFRKSIIEIVLQTFAAFNFYLGYGNKFFVFILSFFLTPVPTQNLWIFILLYFRSLFSSYEALVYI